jgi:hypothetical protein
MVENIVCSPLRSQAQVLHNAPAVHAPPAGELSRIDSTARFSRERMVTEHPRDFVVEHPTVEQTEGDFSIVRVRSHHERVFVRELRAEAIGYYLPVRCEKRYRRGRRLESYVPLFRGLVFVANGAEGRKVVADSRCVTSNCFINVAPSYQPQLRRELIQLQTVLSHQPDAEAFPELLPGREVEVRGDVDHWARGLRGKITRRDGRDVFVVLITILGRQVEVSNMPGELLEVIGNAA